MNIKQATDNVGGLSTPGKMPGYGWSISARRCDVGSSLVDVKGSVCEGCMPLKADTASVMLRTPLKIDTMRGLIIVNYGLNQ